MSRPITLFTGQWADLSFEMMCSVASDMGYDGLEIATWGKHIDVNRGATDDTYIDVVKGILDKYNLSIWAISAHLSGQLVGDVLDMRHNNFVPEAIKDNKVEMKAWALEHVRQTIETANKLDVKVITGFMGSPIWNYWYAFPQTTEQMIEEGYQKVVDDWTPLFDLMDDYGIKYALEIHPTEIAFDYYSFMKLLKAFSYRDTLKVNFDPSHLLWQGIQPHLVIRNLGERIEHVHIKDVGITLDGLNGILGSHLPFGDTRRGWNFKSPGRGDVDFDAIIRELNQINYEGPLSIEWEDAHMDRIMGATEALDYTRKVNIVPFKGSFDDALKN